MKWEVKKIKSGADKGKWGIYLMQKYCKTEDPVCYGAAINKVTAKSIVKRMNDPDYWNN